MDLEFRNLTYTIQSRLSKVPRKMVVKGVNGKFQCGKLVAIMGPSGAGKSSLLNVISGYRSAGVTGELLVNGEPRKEHLFQRSSCYITQEDLLQPFLTVREAMDVAAKLKLPKGSKTPSVEILQELGLVEHQYTRTDKLSGGQKKRLSIALELVNNPPVFFLDEPTSGLDTVATTQCVKLLRQLAQQGRTVVCTIHQPAASLLELFDQVIPQRDTFSESWRVVAIPAGTKVPPPPPGDFLVIDLLYVIADGYCIYQGDTSAMVPYLQSVGLSCPRHHNPADFIIEITEKPENIKLLSQEIQHGKLYKTAKLEHSSLEPVNNMELKLCYQTDGDPQETEIMLTNENCTYKVQQYDNPSTSVSSLSSQLSHVDSSLTWMKVQKSSDSLAYATSNCQQFSILLKRMLIQISRNRQGLWIQLAHHILCGLLIGICFFNMANDGAQMFNHLKLCVGLVIFFAYTQIMIPVLVYPQEVKLVKKEHFNCWYGLTAYYAALTISKLPVQVTLNILFSTIVYFMAGIPFNVSRFVVFCFVGIIVSLASEGMGLAIGSMFNVTNGCAIGPAAIAPFLGLGVYGFDFAHEISFLMNMVMKTSFIRCGIVAMVLTMFGFNRQPLECREMYCHFSKPEVLLKYLDIDTSSVWIEIMSILGLLFVFRSLCYIGLRWRFAT